MSNHPNRARDLPPHAVAMKAYLARHGLTLTTGAERLGVSRDWLRSVTAGSRGTDTMGQVLASCLDRL